jgi:hypothetical protein
MMPRMLVTGWRRRSKHSGRGAFELLYNILIEPSDQWELKTAMIWARHLLHRTSLIATHGLVAKASRLA